MKLRLTISSIFLFMGIHLVWTFQSQVDLTISVEGGANLLIGNFFAKKEHENDNKFDREGVRP